LVALSILYDVRTRRLTPELLDDRVGKLVNGLKEREFLKGTVFEQRAVAQGLDPYSLLVGVALGAAATLLVGIFTIELWLPRAIARVTGKTLTEVTRTVQEILT